MTPNDNSIKEVNVEDAKKMMANEKPIVIDIRSALDFETENISGARHIASQEEFDQFVEQTDKQQPIICYCYFGNSSMGVCAALQEHGFLNAYSLAGGFDAWKQASE